MLFSSSLVLNVQEWLFNKISKIIKLTEEGVEK
jgi:hypothetical protein